MSMEQGRPPTPLQQELERALRARDEKEAAAVLARMHPAQIADRLEATPGAERLWLWPLVDHAVRGAVLVEVRRGVRRQLVALTSAKDLAAAAHVLDLDELADIHRDLPPPVLEAALCDMNRERRRRFEAVRHYPDDTAGGLMDLDAVEVREDLTLEAALEYLRRMRTEGGGLPPHHLDALTVVDREGRCLGVLPLTTLIIEEPQRLVREVMDARASALPALMPAREVGRIFRDHDLVSAPVVDEDGRLVGRITVDDVMDVIQAHGERAMMSHSGLDVESDIFAPLPASVRLRSGWLGLHLIGVLIAAWVIDLFSATIQEVVALAALLPVVASMGGVAGNPSSTICSSIPAAGRRVVTAALGEWLDSGVIFGVVLIIAVIGFVQEGRAERALEAVRGMLSPKARVRRGGQAAAQIPAEELVPGDIVLLDAGDRVPADVRLIHTKNLQARKRRSPGVDGGGEAPDPVAEDAELGDRAEHGLSPARSSPPARARACRGHRRCHRDRAHQRHALRGRDAQDAADAAPRRLHQGAERRDHRSCRLFTFASGCSSGAGTGARCSSPPSHRGRRDPGRAAGGDDRHARHRRRAHGAAQRHHPPPARGRDAGLGHHHLLRQDRHADAQRDDRQDHPHRTEDIEVEGVGYAPEGGFRIDGRTSTWRSIRLRWRWSAPACSATTPALRRRRRVEARGRSDRGGADRAGAQGGVRPEREKESGRASTSSPSPPSAATWRR
jgi:magnesium transporter